MLGQTFARALGDKRGIVRSGSCTLPMDDTLGRQGLDPAGIDDARSEEPCDPVVGRVAENGRRPEDDERRFRTLVCMSTVLPGIK